MLTTQQVEKLINVISVLAEDKQENKPKEKMKKPTRYKVGVVFSADPIEQTLYQYVREHHNYSTFAKYILAKEFLLKNEEIENEFDIKTYIHNHYVHTSEYPIPLRPNVEEKKINLCFNTLSSVEKQLFAWLKLAPNMSLYMRVLIAKEFMLDYQYDVDKIQPVQDWLNSTIYFI
ncbi:MAG: hypothetical protein ATN31_08670 [Candidatus Epulonipiscioides saccharophilum]|nr:MAG: hypothetical protein ATN31_08670 [Epulopiscium sp. AS2M-Bin001]